MKRQRFLLFGDPTEISNMAVGAHSNMAAPNNKKNN